MKAHSHVLDLRAKGDGVYEITNKYSKVLNVFVCECYSFGAAEYIETTAALRALDVIVINSVWCGYTAEAKRLARESKIGLFDIGDFMAALNRANLWEYLNGKERELFEKNGWL